MLAFSVASFEFNRWNYFDDEFELSSFFLKFWSLWYFTNVVLSKHVGCPLWWTYSPMVPIFHTNYRPVPQKFQKFLQISVTNFLKTSSKFLNYLEFSSKPSRLRVLNPVSEFFWWSILVELIFWRVLIDFYISFNVIFLWAVSSKSVKPPQIFVKITTGFIRNIFNGFPEEFLRISSNSIKLQTVLKPFLSQCFDSSRAHFLKIWVFSALL